MYVRFLCCNYQHSCRLFNCSFGERSITQRLSLPMIRGRLCEITQGYTGWVVYGELPHLLSSNLMQHVTGNSSFLGPDICIMEGNEVKGSLRDVKRGCDELRKRGGEGTIPLPLFLRCQVLQGVEQSVCIGGCHPVCVYVCMYTCILVVVLLGFVVCIDGRR